MTSILDLRAQQESFHIHLKGFAIRSFQEDDNISGSWGYTVGLKSRGDAVCLFARGSIGSENIDFLLTETAEYVRVSRIPRTSFNIPDLTNSISSSPIQLKLVKIPESIIGALKDSLDIHLEGQDPDTKYYWLLISDSNDKLPGEEGYEDFNQIDVATQAHGIDEGSDILDMFDKD